MIRHIVMFSFKEQAQGRSKAENVALTKAMLEELPQKISLIRSSRVELNAPGASEENCEDSEDTQTGLDEAYESWEDAEDSGENSGIEENRDEEATEEVSEDTFKEVAE